ncbi:protein-lysine 6-oxidase-like [Anarhichas minor]|uniref:protein-lysine 6-oxidase-like n=1 Tax=Anarhichas minor TaxID=65739 RepID=UPI003F7320D3
MYSQLPIATHPLYTLRLPSLTRGPVPTRHHRAGGEAEARGTRGTSGCHMLYRSPSMRQLPPIFGQQQRAAGPWRHRIQWENNGQVYNLISTGSEYTAPVQSRSQTRLYVAGRRDSSRSQMPGAHRGATLVRPVSAESRQFRTDHSAEPRSIASVRDVRHYVPFNGRASGARQQPDRPHGAAAAGYRGARRTEHTITINGSSPGRLTDVAGRRRGNSLGATALHTRGGEPGPGAQYLERESEAPALSPALSEDDSNEANGNGEDMVNDDPRNPLKNHRNSVFYNSYPTRGRSGARTRRPPGTGYGTRYFQNGLPDLIPDPYAIQAGAYIQRMQMFALRCAAEENCLARSAYRPAVKDIDFRVLLRFPQKVKNQGTTDFLPVKPRYQWDWHSCHQHFHSMEAFSNYDLLDIVTERKVAEGHKASFCLEDTGCDPGFRRRYACTSHTQGLSPGCHDIYAANIDCQWIDITDVPPGNYILKVTVNPNFHVLESDFTNNIVRCDIIYTGTYVQTRNCRLSRG